MPRSSRHSKSHGRHKKRSSAEYYSSSESEDDRSPTPRYGRSEKEKEKEKKQHRSSKSDNVVENDYGGSSSSNKRKSSPIDLRATSKRKKGNVSDDRWKDRDALSLVDKDYESDNSSEKSGHKSKHHWVSSNGNLGEVHSSSAKGGKSKDDHDFVTGKHSKGRSDESRTEEVGPSLPLAMTVEGARNMEISGSVKLMEKEDSTQDKKSGKSVDWRLQDDNRNPELEKELENRILRRREEVGDRDRYKDDDRNRDGKSHLSRDNQYKDERYRSRQKDDRHKTSRHKEERKSDDKSSRNDRYKEDKYLDEKLRVDRHKDDKSRDDRQREDRPKEERNRDFKHKDEKHKDEKHQDVKFKDEKAKCERTRDDKPDDNFKDGKHKEEKHRTDSHKIEKPKNEKQKAEQSFPDSTAERSDGKQHRSDIKNRGHDYESKHSDSDGYSSYSFEKNKYSEKKEKPKLHSLHDIKARTEEYSESVDRVCETKPIQQKPSSSLQGITKTNVPVKAGQQDIVLDSGIVREQKRLKSAEPERAMDSRNIFFEEKNWHGTDRTHTQVDRHQISKEDSYAKRRNRTDRHSDSYREDSPVGSTDSPSRSDESSRSTSPYDRRTPERTHKRKRSDSDRAFSRTSAKRGDMQRGDDRTGSSGKIRSKEQTDISKDNNYRGRSRSRDGYRSSHMYESKSDRLSRASSVNVSQEDAGGDQHSKRSIISGHGHDRLKVNKSSWSPYGQTSKSAGPSGQPRTTFPIRPSSQLPPAPPYRPGIDNPTILGPNNGFDEAPRDQGRSDWNSRNWNSQHHIPVSNNMFMPFHPQVGRHPSAAFPNLGQHPGFPFYRGMRPPPEMGPGMPYPPAWDNGDGVPGHNGVFGWQRPPDDAYQGPFQNWDAYNDDSLYSQREWIGFGHGIGTRGWERPSNLMRGPKMDSNMNTNQNDEDEDNSERSLERYLAESNEEQRSDVGAQGVTSETHTVAASTDTRKSYRHVNEGIKYYLSNIDVSSKLAGPCLYNQYQKMLGQSFEHGLNDASMREAADSEDDQLEVDSEVELFLSSRDLRNAFFPLLSDDHMQNIQDFLKNRSLTNSTGFEFDEETCYAGVNEATITVEVNPLEETLEHSVLSGTEVHHDNPELQTDTKGILEDTRSCAQDSNHANGHNLAEDSSMSNQLLSRADFSSDSSNKDFSGTVDDRALAALHAFSADGKTNVSDTSAHSLVPELVSFSSVHLVSSNVCKTCLREGLIGLNELCLTCQAGNELNADVSANRSVQQNELLESARVAAKRASEFDLVYFKELVSAACILHILREVSFHVRIPAIPHTFGSGFILQS